MRKKRKARMKWIADHVARGARARPEGGVEDAIARMRNATPQAGRALLNNLLRTQEQLQHSSARDVAANAAAKGGEDRRRRDVADRRLALCPWLAVAAMNLESHHLPGANCAGQGGDSLPD